MIGDIGNKSTNDSDGGRVQRGEGLVKASEGCVARDLLANRLPPGQR